MGDWNNVTYVRAGDAAEVERAIAALFATEGREAVRAPRSRKLAPLHRDPMQYGRARESDLWGVAIVPAERGFTVVRSAPFDLLVERAPGASRPRLAALAERLGTSALAFNLYDSTDGVLVEATAAGAALHSGFTGQSPSGPPAYYDEPYPGDEHAQPHFRLLDPRALFAAAPDGPAKRLVLRLRENPYPAVSDIPASQIAAALRELAGDATDNGINACTLVEHQKLAPPARVRYFRRAAATGEIDGERLQSRAGG
jgi:hypothetical protein